MICGVFFKLDFPYAHFETKGILLMHTILEELEDIGIDEFSRRLKAEVTASVSYIHDFVYYSP